MHSFYMFYVNVFAVILPLCAAAIGSIGVAQAQLSYRQTAFVISIAALVFGIWFATASKLAELNVFNVPDTINEAPVVLLFLVGGTLAIWWLSWMTDLGRLVTLATPLSAIASFQILRVMGGVFLIGWIAGDIPALFALPAGLGDILAGITGWKAAHSLKGSPSYGRRWLIWANLIGIADFILAVGLGIVTSSGFAYLALWDSPNIINDHPLALFPAYFVPIFLAFHFLTIARLRYDGKRRQ